MCTQTMYCLLTEPAGNIEEEKKLQRRKDLDGPVGEGAFCAFVFVPTSCSWSSEVRQCPLSEFFRLVMQMETIQVQQMRSVSNWGGLCVNDCIHKMAVNAKYNCPWVSTLCECNAFQSGASKYMTVYEGAQNGCFMCMYSIHTCKLDLIGPCCSRERTGRAESAASCFGSWHSLCPGRGGRRGRCTLLPETTAADKSEDTRGQDENGELDFCRSYVQTTSSKGAQGVYLADVVWADGGDGLEGQLLAADAHEDLLQLSQEILSWK